VRRVILFVFIALVVAVPTVAAADGPLIVVGGGEVGHEIVAKALQLGGGKDAVVAVLPQASAEPDAGDGAVSMFREAGARSAAKISFADEDAAASLRRATLIWIPGGDQNRFMAAIAGTGLDEVIRERHRAGVAIGGTSAGAAVMADAMFTGDADLKSLTAGSTVIAKGLGLWAEVLVDQHFLKRQRDNRLISAVLDRPSLVGVGIDEATAVVVTGGSFEVLGASSVVVVDARHAQVDRAAPGALVSARDVRLSVLRAGQHFSLR
jgi:cyanophycinase